MKAHTRKFMARFDRAFTTGKSNREALGTKDPNFFRTMQMLIAATEIFLPLFKEAFKSREHFIAIIDKLDPNDKEYPVALAFVDNLPKFGRYLATEIGAIGKNTTVAPRSGRPHSLHPKEEREVVDFIHERRQKNPYETLADSQARAAKTFGISPRTCRRIWNARHEPRLTVEEMSKMLIGFLQNTLLAAEQKVEPTAAGAALTQALKFGADDIARRETQGVGELTAESQNRTLPPMHVSASRGGSRVRH